MFFNIVHVSFGVQYIFKLIKAVKYEIRHTTLKMRFLRCLEIYFIISLTGTFLWLYIQKACTPVHIYAFYYHSSDLIRINTIKNRFDDHNIMSPYKIKLSLRVKKEEYMDSHCVFKLAIYLLTVTIPYGVDSPVCNFSFCPPNIMSRYKIKQSLE